MSVGVKEKALAARRAGVTTIILPQHNEKDLGDIPPNVREEMQFRFVDVIGEVLDIALEAVPIPVGTSETGFRQEAPPS